MPLAHSPRPLRAVLLNGSLSRPSRTQQLLEAIGAALQDHRPLEIVSVELADLVPHLGGSLSAQTQSAAVRQAIATLGEADLLVVGCPVFRGSLPGLFKHLLDLVEQDALIGKPVLLAATGGSSRHALVIDHQLRPLFAFFQTLTLPIGVYATSADFADGRIVDPALAARVRLAAELAAPALAHLGGPARTGWLEQAA
ncbi:FMN reductase [Verticiella sediminum]|uniref:FMN reductase n=1 Tax=Verticiella sediminum TaxID=1247510 RepID=A0A556ANM8_9BURK|nr:FMN reductase [Verticiella sediminum]TSH94481.1 FMN reductase [Verticiella sediminum]